MANIINQLITFHTYLFTDIADPRVKDLPLMGTPWSTLLILAFYLYITLSFGPKFMEKRQPFKLHRILQIYNILNIIISVRLFMFAISEWFFHGYSFICEPVDLSTTPRAMKITRYVHYYFLNKLLDLLDTILFILRRKDSQVTFLHIYHHVGIVAGAWATAKYIPGGHLTFVGLLNTFVHSLMYLYYLLASMKINVSYWKKYLTQIQLIQFFLIVIHDLQLFVIDCDYPLWPLFLNIPQNIFFIILFGDFYYKSYILKKPIKEETPLKIEPSNIDVVKEKAKEQ